MNDATEHPPPERVDLARLYADTDIETVARRTRVTRGALYHHFKDKQDLFSAVFDLEEQKLTTVVARAGSAKSGWDGIIAASQAFSTLVSYPAGL